MLVSQPGTESTPPELAGQSLNHSTTREVPLLDFEMWVLAHIAKKKKKKVTIIAIFKDYIEILKMENHVLFIKPASFL